MGTDDCGDLASITLFEQKGVLHKIAGSVEIEEVKTVKLQPNETIVSADIEVNLAYCTQNIQFVIYKSN